MWCGTATTCRWISSTTVFEWPTNGGASDDLIGLAAVQPAQLRLIVDDGTHSWDCAVDIDVDNAPLCPSCGDCDGSGGLPPSILDALLAAQIAAGVVVPHMLQQVCCDVDMNATVDVLDALRLAQSAAGLPGITLSCC